MPYNYYKAFEEKPIVELSLQMRREIAATAIVFFVSELPHIKVASFKILLQTKHIDIKGEGEYRIYSWKELGFDI